MSKLLRFVLKNQKKRRDGILSPQYITASESQLAPLVKSILCMWLLITLSSILIVNF